MSMYRYVVTRVGSVGPGGSTTPRTCTLLHLTAVCAGPDMGWLVIAGHGHRHSPAGMYNELLGTSMIHVVDGCVAERAGACVMRRSWAALQRVLKKHKCPGRSVRVRHERNLACMLTTPLPPWRGALFPLSRQGMILPSTYLLAADVLIVTCRLWQSARPHSHCQQRCQALCGWKSILAMVPHDGA